MNIPLFVPLRKVVNDTYIRPDSTTTLGNTTNGIAWTAGIGTWGISSNQAYSVSDTSGDVAFVTVGSPDMDVSITMKGDITDAANQRAPLLVFRCLSNNTFLMARVVAGLLALIKNDSGTFTTLTTASQTIADDTFYTLKVSCVQNRVVVYVNGVPKIDYTLTGGDTVYSGATYNKAGIRLSKAGTPDTAARFKDFFAEII